MPRVLKRLRSRKAPLMVWSSIVVYVSGSDSYYYYHDYYEYYGGGEGGVPREKEKASSQGQKGRSNLRAERSSTKSLVLESKTNEKGTK
jgi:hypothetical protein